MQPIWKDYYITHPVAVSYVDYTISVDNVPVFSGRAYTRPGETYPRFRINDIVADYLTRTFPLEEDDTYFHAVVVSHGGYTTTETFTRDWSYDADFVPTQDFPVAPILPDLNPQQYLPMYARYGIFDFSLYFRYNTGSFNLDFNEDFSVDNVVESDYEEENEGHFFFIPLADYEGAEKVTANGITRPVADICGGYVLYYINAYGGWDSIIVQGRAIRTDGVTHYTREAVYDNRTYQARGTDNYVNEITPKMRLTIGPLTTAQSSRMYHLLESTFIYLHDIEKGRIHPVTITATSVEHKVRPGALHIYEFEVALAQNRIRR